MKFYETYNQPDFNNPLPWAQGPRRMGTDKFADVLWVGNSWGANLARIDTHTREVKLVFLPGEQQPYHVAVDKNHDAWTNLWGADRVMRYDPYTQRLDRVRPADARRRAALRLIARTARPGHKSRAALLPRPQSRGDDLAQQDEIDALKRRRRSNLCVIPGRGLCPRAGIHSHCQ